MVVIAVLISLTVSIGDYIAASGRKEKADFMAYCRSKGHTTEDCRWAWKAMERGENPQVLRKVE